jgi:hypothetical protein
MPARRIDLGQLDGIQPAQAGIGRRDQPAIVQARADVAGGAHGIATVVEAGADGADLFADAGFFGHGRPPAGQGASMRNVDAKGMTTLPSRSEVIMSSYKFVVKHSARVNTER